MKLIKCDITNFGKLNDFKYDFTDGLNTINEENGFGKTTLATFLKVMFYGFKKAGRTKKESDNERKKFLPWNGNKCSGSLTFEYNGKQYEIQRSFGEKPSQDKVKIISLDTKKETNDFRNPEYVGLEIFGIDCESYEKSSYFPQVSDDFSISDDIRKKFTDLVEGADDSLGFGAALSVLEEKKKSYDSNRKEALIKTINAELLELNGKLEELNNKYDSLDNIKQELKEAKDLEFDCKESLNELEKRINVVNNNKTLLEIKESLDSKNMHIKKIQNDLENIKLKKLASKDIIYEVSHKVNKLSEVDNKLDSLKKNPYIKELENSTLAEVDLESISTKVDKYNSLNVSKISEEILNKYNDLNNVYNDLEKGKINEVKNELVSSNISILTFIPCVLSILFLLFGIIFIREIIGKVLVLTAILPALVFIFLLFKGKNNNNEKVLEFFKKYYKGDSSDYNQMIDQIEREYEKYIEYKNIIVDDTKKNDLILKEKDALRAELDIVFRNFDFNYSGYNEALAALKYKLGRKEELLIEVKKINEEIKEMEDIRNQIIIDLDSVFTEYNAIAVSYNESLDILKTRFNTYNKLANDINELIQEKNAFIKDKKITNDMFDRLEIVEDIDKLIDEKNVVSKKLEDTLKRIANLDGQISSITTECEEIDEIVNEIASKEETKRGYEKEVNILNTTILCLNKAKESLASSYLKPMEKSFDKYLNLLDETFEGAVINEDFNIEAKRFGENKEIGYFSKGYVDLLYICIRLALVENLFKGEKPVLVLDDPFVNLDEKKIGNALKLLEVISKEYQIIYMICHSSRA